MIRSVRTIGLALALLVACASPARAATMTHLDLASLALEADVVVRAERTGGADDAASYRVVRLIAGRGLRVGDTVTLDQRLYFVDTTGTHGAPIAGPVEPAAILFLRAGSDRSQPAWSLVGSGLRIVAGGRVYRFEQWSNPGPYVAVPQRRDPEDVRGVATDEHWDLARLEQGVAAAIARADRARAAIASRDPAAVLALMPAEAVARDGFGGHAYEDRIAVRGFEALLAAGHLDAALDVLARTRGARPWSVQVEDAELMARAESSAAPLARRIAALSLLDLLPGDDTVRRLIAIARNDTAPAALRVAAVEELAGYEGVSGSDDDWPRRRRALQAALRSLVHDVSTTGPPSVRTALVACAARWELRGAVPRAHLVAASAVRRGDVVEYHVAAAPGTDPTVDAIAVLRDDGTPCAAEVITGWSSAIERHGRIDLAACDSATDIRFTLRGRRRTITAPIER